MGFFVPGDRIQKIFWPKRTTNKDISFSSEFSCRIIRGVYIKDVGRCLISQDVYTAVGFNIENGAETIQRLVPGKYRMRLGDAVIDMKEVDKNVHLHPDTVLLKEPDLYCFLLRCKMDEAEPFMEWVVESFTARGSKISLSHRIKRCSTCPYEWWSTKSWQSDSSHLIWECALQAQRDVYRTQLQKCRDIIIHLKTCYVPHARDPGKDNIITSYGNTQSLSMISFMNCHIKSRGYSDVKGMLN